MSRAERLGLLFVAVALAALSASPPASAQQPGRGSSRTEQERKRILNQLGLEPKTKQPPPAGDVTPSPDAPAPVEASPAASGSASPPAPVSPPPTPFAGRVHGVLLASCRTCHIAGGPAAATRLVLTGDVERDHAAARRLVNPRTPRRSLLLTKATGVAHGGGATLAAASEPYRRLLQWVSGGAVLTASSTKVAAPSTPAPSNTPARRPAVRAIAPAKPTRAEQPPPPAVAQDTPPSTETPASETPVAVAAAPAAPPSASVAAPSTFATAQLLHGELIRSCRPCHAQGAVAGPTRYVLTGKIRSDLVASRPFVAGRPPEISALVAKAAGKAHGGGSVWPEGSAGRRAALAWIEAGSPVAPEPPPATGSDAPAAPREPAAGSSTAPPMVASPPSIAVATPPAPPIGPGGHAGGHPLRLTFLSNTLTLNGRFDLNFERRGFQTNPFDGSGQNALASYHHFLFLSRTSSADPISLTAEVVNLQFYEIAARLSPRRAPWRLHVRAGRIIVPFGAEPLFHQNYGGHAGFDQRVLPAIWTAEGASASAGTEWGRLSLSGDVFAINGYELRRADGVVNLKSDFAALDEARVAPGARVGAAWGSVWAFYSTLINPLGFGRTMFMQAVDVGLWRWRDVPFLGRFVLGAGFLRADIFGGGAGQDYYHFASYWLARYYLLDWLAIQYRQGLRVFNNRRGVIGDDTRYGTEDGSTHNVALVARYHGLSLGLAYFINLEKAGEINDDLLRFTVALDF